MNGIDVKIEPPDVKKIVRTFIVCVLVITIILLIAGEMGVFHCNPDKDITPTQPKPSLMTADRPIPDTLNVGVSLTSGYDLFFVTLDSTYLDFGEGCQGLICGDWTQFGDSTRYQCFVACKDSGADTTSFVWKYPNRNHYFPGLVTVLVVYEGKVFLYASKTVFDWGNTNCKPGVVKQSNPDPTIMTLTSGCGDRYDPNVFTKPFGQGDKIMIVPVLDAAKKLKESNRSNNIAFLPLRKDTTFFDPKQGQYPGWVLDMSAVDQRNINAINRWLRRNFVN